MKILVQYLAVAGAGAVGSVLRLVVTQVCGRWFGTGFPVGTMIINLSGSFLLGWFMMLVNSRVPVSDTTRMVIAVGFVGAYTTFSTFIFDTNEAMLAGAHLKAGANLALSIVLGLIAVRAGMWVAAR